MGGKTKYFFTCTNDSCSNITPILKEIDKKESIQLKCDMCGQILKQIKLKNESGDSSGYSLEQELIQYTKKILFITKAEYNLWPGPIAVEYRRLIDILNEGNCEGACWKLINLCEVILLYFNAAAIEKDKLYYIKFKDYNIKDSDIREVFNNNKLNKILEVISDIKKWRNSIGIGHGTLTENKSVMIKSITSYFEKLNECLKNLNSVLEQEKLSLYCGKKKLLGINYTESIGISDAKGKVFISSYSELFQPIKIFCYQFDGPDIYFIDVIKIERSFKYRNFMSNRIKYVDIQTKEISWHIGSEQVAWLIDGEKESWLSYFDIESKKDMQTLDILLNAAEEFQEKGMYEDAIRLVQKYKELELSNKDLNLRSRIVEYDINMMKYGKPKNTENQINELLKLITEEEINYEQKFLLKKSWYVGMYEDYDEGIRFCNELLEKIDKLDKTYEIDLAKLQLEKNKLYFMRKTTKEEGKIIENIEECTKLIIKATNLMKVDVNNFKVIDIIGFACNLYGQFLFKQIKLLKKNPNKQQIEQAELFQKYGEKIRKRSYEKNKNNVLAARGYAWSIHHSGRIKEYFYQDYNGAIELYKYAFSKLLECENRYGDGDLGVKEDIVKNHVDLIKAGIKIKLPKEKLIELKEEADKRKQYIKNKEGETLRYRKLKSLLDIKIE